MSQFIELPRKSRLKPDLTASPDIEAPQPSEQQILALQSIPGEPVTLQPESRLIFHTDTHSVAADRFRYLRMRLREFWSTGRLKSLLITSPLPEDGKSTTALNLATALCERGKRRVLLIEADLYHSPLQTLLGIDRRAGLAECIQSDLSLERAIRRLEPLGWFLLPAGSPQGNPTELLHTEGLARLLQKVSLCFDWVLVDSPPIIPVVDALLLKQHCQATLLVTRAGRTPRELIDKSVTLLGREHLLGVVFNGVENLDREHTKYSKYYGYYAQGDA